MNETTDKTWTPEQFERAYRLYAGDKTDTQEYKEIAKACGLTTGELNAKLAPVYRERHYGTGQTEAK